MKHFFTFTTLFIAIFLLAVRMNIHAQDQMSTELNYKEKGRTISSALIYFSDNNGAENVSPEDFLLYQVRF